MSPTSEADCIQTHFCKLKVKNKQTTKHLKTLWFLLGIKKKNATSVYFSPPYTSLQYWQYPNTDCTTQGQLTKWGLAHFHQPVMNKMYRSKHQASES